MKKCIKCGIEKSATSEFFQVVKANKDGLRGECRECTKEYHKAYKKTYIKPSSEAIREHKALQSREWKEANKERLVVWHKEYRKNNKSSISISMKEYRQENKVSLAEYHSKYQKEHLEERKIRQKRRKEKMLRLPNNLTPEQWCKIMKDFDSRCAYCGEEKPLEQEHFHPLHLGGEYTMSNIVPACKSCNSSKGVKLFSDWYSLQTYYDKQRENKILTYLGYKNSIQQLSFV